MFAKTFPEYHKTGNRISICFRTVLWISDMLLNKGGQPNYEKDFNNYIKY